MTEECFTQDGIDAETRCTQGCFLDADQGVGHTLDLGRKPTLTVQPVEEEGSFTPECLEPLVGFIRICLRKPEVVKGLIMDSCPALPVTVGPGCIEVFGKTKHLSENIFEVEYNVNEEI